MPYAYDVVMYREPDAGDIDPKRIINLVATIYMRGKIDDYNVRRKTASPDDAD